MDYRHYFGELARKPQAVRRVAPELVAALGEPFGRLWTRLEREQGAQEGARTLARLLRAVDEHGQQRVHEVLEQALAGGSFDELAVQLGRRASARPLLGAHRFERWRAACSAEVAIGRVLGVQRVVQGATLAGSTTYAGRTQRVPAL